MRVMDRTHSYREQDGCVNCCNRFELHDWDEPIRFFCEFDKVVRPSILRGININLSEADWNIEAEKWREWANTREVMAYGICEFWNKTASEVKP